MQTVEVCRLGTRVMIHSNAHDLLQAVQVRFGPLLEHSGTTPPVELTVIRDGDRYRAMMEGREETLALANKWPRFDELVQLIIERERPDLFFVHGSCVAIQNNAALLFGSSTAGKTTLGLALSQCGFDLISEDTTPVSMKKALVYPYVTNLNLRHHTAELVDKQQWNCSFLRPQQEDAAGLVLRWIVHVTPKTHSRTTWIKKQELQEWEKFRSLTGRLSHTEVPMNDCEVAVRTQADFDCPPELMQVRKSQLLRELMRHTHFSPKTNLASALHAAMLLIERTQCICLVPGNLKKTTMTLSQWMNAKNTFPS